MPPCCASSKRRICVYYLHMLMGDFHMATSMHSSRPVSTVRNSSYRVQVIPALLIVPARRRRIGSHVDVKASMGGVLDTVVTYGALSLSVGATAYTLFYKLPCGKSGDQKVPLTQPEDNFTWGVMGAVSAFPLFNYMAWVLGALQSDNPTPYYWAAALYTLPLIRNGLDQDWFSWTLLLLGVAHVQALRIAATEPETQAKLQQQLKPLSLIATIANSAGRVATAIVGASSTRSSSKQRQLGPADDSNLVSQLLKSKGDDADEGNVLQRLELEEFDRRLQESADKQQRQQQQQIDADPKDSDWD